MLMKRLCFIIITCLALIQFSTASAAAQSSLNSGRDEFKTLINDRQFTGKLDPSDTIVAIYRTKTGFTILTDKHKMHVDVVVDKSSKAGGGLSSIWSSMIQLPERKDIKAKMFRLRKMNLPKLQNQKGAAKLQKAAVLPMNDE